MEKLTTMSILFNEMTIGERLKRFIKKCYKTNINFGLATGIDPAVISRYINNQCTPNLESLIKFYHAGLSVSWLVVAEGEMFSKNQVGQRLQKSQPLRDLNTDKILIKTRIEQWIIEYFISIENFSKITNFSIDKIKNVLCGTDILELNFLTVLIDNGCQIEWLQTGEGSPYQEFSKGREISYNREKNIDSKLNSNGTTISELNILKIFNEELKIDLNNNEVI